MNKKFIAVLCAISSVMSLTVAVQATDTVILDDDFSSGNTGYETTVPSINGRIEVSGNALLHQHDNNGWDENAGIKKEISAELKENNLKKGDKLTVSVDIYCGWYGGTATASLKIDGMNDIKLGQAIPEQGNNEDRTITLEGSVTVAQDIPESYSNAYFVVTQPCSYVTYDNIKLTLTQDDGDTPVDPPEVSTMLIDNSIFDKFEVYDTSSNDTTGTIQSALDNGLQVQFETEWNENHGVKADITDKIQGYSGRKFTLSIDTKNGAWEGSENTINKANAFFEIVSSNGSKSTFKMAEGPNEATTNNATVTLTGSTDLTFSNTDKVYLCFTHGAGQHEYKNLTLSVSGEAVSPTEQPTEQPTNPPVEGEWTEVINTTGYTQDQIQALLNNNTITEYVSDSNAGHGISVNPNEYNGKPCIDTKSSWNAFNGLKIDISKYVKNGSSVKATFGLKSNDSNNAEVSLLENDGVSSNKFTHKVTSSRTWETIDTTAFTVTADNNVYLTIANQSGDFYIADLVISVKGGVSSDVPVFSYEPATFTGELEGAKLSDDGKTLTSGDEVVTAYKCSYSGKAENGLKVVVKDGDKQGEATTTTKITDVTDIVFYVVTNHAKVDSIKVTPIE